MRLVPLGLFAAMLLVASCGGPANGPENMCPPTLTGGPSQGAASIQWGGDKGKVQATILSVALECFPVHHPAVEGQGVKIEAHTDYQIAATADVAYAILDQAFYTQATRYANLEGTVVFEAKSASGVVLGSGTAKFQIVSGGTSGTASGKILGLSGEEIQKAATVEARWEYGHSSY